MRMLRLGNARPAGFSLIELMIAVAIVAILAAIAYPSYQRYVQQSHRNAVQTEMTSLAQNFERCRTRANSYNACGLVDAFNDELSEGGRYRFTVEAAVGTFTITATPQALGGQTNDRCGLLTLNHQGVRTVGGANATVEDCW